MGRLKALRPGPRPLAPRIGFAEGDAKGYDRSRAGGPRDWYKLKRWLDLRLEVFVRDGFVCQQTGELCSGAHPAPNSPVADHIVPHRGDPALFWDRDNIQTVSKAYHDRQKQRLERRLR